MNEPKSKSVNLLKKDPNLIQKIRDFCLMRDKEVIRISGYAEYFKSIEKKEGLSQWI